VASRFDVDVANTLIKDVEVKGPLKFGPVVRLNDFDLEGQTLQEIVEELNCRLLVVLRVDPQHSHPGAVVDRRVLVVTLLQPGNRLNELDVDLDAVPGRGFS